MNKQYIVDIDGKVLVITDQNELVERNDIYTENINTILSLENLSELLSDKIHLFEKRINELNNSIRTKNKTMRLLNISLILLSFILIIIGIAVSEKLSLIVSISIIPLSVIIKKIEDLIVDKDKKTRNKYQKKLQEETHKKNKIEKRINSLPKEKATIEEEKINTYIDIKPIENYNIDTSDYFIEKYLIDKRVEQMTQGKKKVKKKTNTGNNLEYEI